MCDHLLQTEGGVTKLHHLEEIPVFYQFAYRLTVTMNVVPRSTKDTNGETES